MKNPDGRFSPEVALVMRLLLIVVVVLFGILLQLQAADYRLVDRSGNTVMPITHGTTIDLHDLADRSYLRIEAAFENVDHASWVEFTLIHSERSFDYTRTAQSHENGWWSVCPGRCYALRSTGSVMLKSKVWFSDGQPSPAVGVIETDAVSFRVTDSKPTIRPPVAQPHPQAHLPRRPRCLQGDRGNPSMDSSEQPLFKPPRRQSLTRQRRVHPVSLMVDLVQMMREAGTSDPELLGHSLIKVDPNFNTAWQKTDGPEPVSFSSLTKIGRQSGSQSPSTSGCIFAAVSMRSPAATSGSSPTSSSNSTRVSASR